MNDGQHPVSREEMERFWQEQKGHSGSHIPAPFDRRRAVEVPISSSTRIQLTAPQIWLILVAVVSGAVAFCTTYYGLTSRMDQNSNKTTSDFYEVKAQLTEINYRLRATMSRDDFRNWSDHLRDSNPNIHVPSPMAQNQ